MTFLKNLSLSLLKPKDVDLQRLLVHSRSLSMCRSTFPNPSRNNLWPWNQSWLFMLGLILYGFIQPRSPFTSVNLARISPLYLLLDQNNCFDAYMHAELYIHMQSCIYAGRKKIMIYAIHLLTFFQIESHIDTRPHGEWLWFWMIKPGTWPV